MAARWRSERGLTLLEVALMLIVSAALVAGLAPTLAATVSDARVARADTDMTNISLAINTVLAVDGFTRFTFDGSQVAANEIEFLFSDGDIPNAGGGSANWLLTTASATEDFLEEHLVANLFNGAVSYPLPPGANPRWRGAYMNAPIDPDPWGNRYAVNSGNIASGANSAWVLSAGPDEDIDTGDTGLFNLANILTAGDRAVLVEN